jgi:ABC-type bacteriocin/lantibiotic exporter with double-glycine peptidase domain
MFKSFKTLNARMRDGSIREIIDDWKWIFTYSKKYKKAIIFYTVLGLVSTTLGFVTSLGSKYLVDAIVGHKSQRLGVLIAVVIGGTVFNIVFNSALKRISAKLSLDINNEIQADVFDKIMDADWMALSEFTNGDVLNRFNSDIYAVSSNAISWLPTIIITIYNFCTAFVLLLYFDKTIALLALCSAPILFVLSRIFLKKQRDYGKRVKKVSSEMMSFETEAFNNFDTIKSFGVSSYYGQKMRRRQKKYKEISLEYNLFSIKASVWIQVAMTLIEYAVCGYGLYRLWTGDITYGTMVLLLQQGTGLSNSFNRLASVVPSFLNSSICANRIRELTELPREIHVPESAKLNEYIKDGFKIRMKGVSFSYKQGTEIISDSGFKASPGEIVALVGPSGEGKTTMIRLLLGLVKPTEGKVVIVASNGESVHMNAETRHLFSYVPQGNTILSGTIASNLRMVKENATDEEIIEVLKIACAWEFVQKMPKTIHSEIGEHGRGLSEGQAQRIAIARAILRNTPIMLLDEATSALDPTTERQVLANIIKQRPNKTCIVTTHRPSVLSMCKRVYRVMETKVTKMDEDESGQMVMDF